LSSPYLHTCSIVVFKTILGEVKLLLALNPVSQNLFLPRGCPTKLVVVLGLWSVESPSIAHPPPPSSSSAHFQLFGGKKRFLLSKLNAITCLTITLKWSIAMMEIFLLLNKYPALCKLKLLGAS
jgi:hypothetical protein